MFVSRPIIEFPTSDEAAPSRALNAVVTLVSVGVVLLLVVLTMLSPGTAASHNTHAVSPTVSSHLVGNPH